MLETTRDTIEKFKFTDISMELQELIVMPWFLTQAGGLKVIGGGLGVEHILMTDNGGYSEWVDEFAESTATIIDHLKKMKVNFSLLNDSLRAEIEKCRI